MPPLLSKCFELRSVLQFFLLLFSPLDSHLSLYKSLGVCHVMLNILKKNLEGARAYLLLLRCSSCPPPKFLNSCLIAPMPSS
jgi:hypothetical protein